MSKRSRRSASASSASPYFPTKKPRKLAWFVTDALPDHLSDNRYFSGTEKTILQLEAPNNFSLSQAVCSYGYFCLAPNRWVPAQTTRADDEGYLVRPLRYGKDHESAVSVALGQIESTVIVAFDNSLETSHHEDIVKQASRMLRFDQDLTEFHSLHEEAKELRFGRLYRSPTLFEDMIKTITNCNMKWSGTVDMNAKLCRHVGQYGAFPTPQELQQVTPAFLKENCRLGYRSEWVWSLANDVVEGTLDLQGLEAMGNREDIQQRLLKIKGIGSFASNNILQLMGYFDSFPYDTETVRLWKEDFGAPAKSTKDKIFEQAKEHYQQQYEPYSFIAYWFDLWKNYEQRAGSKSPRWCIEQFESERPTDVQLDHNQVFVNPSGRRKSTREKKSKAVPVTPERT